MLIDARLGILVAIQQKKNMLGQQAPQIPGQQGKNIPQQISQKIPSEADEIKGTPQQNGMAQVSQGG